MLILRNKIRGSGVRGTMAAASPVSLARKVLAGAAMAGPAAIVAREALRDTTIEWPLLAFSGLLAIAGVGMTRTSLVPQVLSRGAAWLTLLPTAMITLERVYRGSSLKLDVAAIAFGTATALRLSRPMLHTKEARSEFAPIAFRRWLLAGSIGTSAVGIAAATAALASAAAWPEISIGLAALAASLFASTVAVVRMRAWGILLGGLTSIALLGAGAFSREGAVLVLAALAAAPPLLMHVLPILVARWGGLASKAAPAEGPRVSLAESATRYRIATEPLETVADDDLEAASPKRAAMAQGT